MGIGIEKTPIFDLNYIISEVFGSIYLFLFIAIITIWIFVLTNGINKKIGFLLTIFITLLISIGNIEGIYLIIVLIVGLLFFTLIAKIINRIR